MKNKTTTIEYDKWEQSTTVISDRDKAVIVLLSDDIRRMFKGREYSEKCDVIPEHLFEYRFDFLKPDADPNDYGDDEVVTYIFKKLKSSNCWHLDRYDEAKENKVGNIQFHNLTIYEGCNFILHDIKELLGAETDNSNDR